MPSIEVCRVFSNEENSCAARQERDTHEGIINDIEAGLDIRDALNFDCAIHNPLDPARLRDG